jgi:hypothetical protein
MQDLTQVAPAIARRFIRVELAKAGISAFEGVLSGSSETRLSVLDTNVFSETRAPLVGMMVFENEALALFVRRWFCWEVRLTKPLPLKPAQELFDYFWRVVRVSGYACSAEPPAGGVSLYHVDSVPGLEALMAKLISAFGNGRAAEPQRLTHETESWIQPGSFKLLPAPVSIAERDELELAGLAAQGLACEKLNV